MPPARERASDSSSPCPEDVALLEYRVGKVEEKQTSHGERIWNLEKSVAKMWGAVGLAIVLIPPLTAYCVSLARFR